MIVENSGGNYKYLPEVNHQEQQASTSLITWSSSLNLVLTLRDVSSFICWVHLNFWIMPWLGFFGQDSIPVWCPGDILPLEYLSNTGLEFNKGMWLGGFAMPKGSDDPWITLFSEPAKLNWILLLTHWHHVMHICVNKLTIIGSDHGLLLGQHQVIIWTNTGILLIGPIRKHFNEMLFKIHAFSFKKMNANMLSTKWWPFCLGLNV